MLEKETADLITLVLIAGIGIELVMIIGLEIWRRLYLQRFAPSTVRAASQSAASRSHQSPSGSLRDTTAAPLHQQKSGQNRRDKK